MFAYSLPIYLLSIQALPDDASYRPVRTEMRVVFPAPFGPNNPKIYFYSKLKELALKALNPFSYVFSKFLIIKGRSL